MARHAVAQPTRNDRATAAVAHPLRAVLLHPTRERPTPLARRIGTRHAHRHLQHTSSGLHRAGHLEVLQPDQRTMLLCLSSGVLGEPVLVASGEVTVVVGASFEF